MIDLAAEPLLTLEEAAVVKRDQRGLMNDFTRANNKTISKAQLDKQCGYLIG
jgi:hypothetical protein